MRNYIQAGEVITLPAPTGGVKSGDGVLIGSLFGVAAYDAAEGEDVEVSLEGVYELPKAAGAIDPGVKVYWVAADKNVSTAGAGNTLIGAATQRGGFSGGGMRMGSFRVGGGNMHFGGSIRTG